MKLVISIVTATFVSASAFAGYGGSFLSCSNKNASVTVVISVTNTGNSASVKGFEKKSDSMTKGADIKIEKVSVASILKDDVKGTLSAVVTSKEGHIIQVLASGLKHNYCSGCDNGLSNTYTSAVALSTGTYGYPEQSGLTCELEIQ